MVSSCNGTKHSARRIQEIHAEALQKLSKKQINLTFVKGFKFKASRDTDTVNSTVPYQVYS